MRLIIALLLALGATVACKRSGAPAPRPEATALYVDNRGYPDMVIYAIDGGRRQRLGTAVGNSTTKLTIPASLIGLGRDLQLLADPIGGSRSSVSDRLFVRPGEEVRLIIPPG
jgi:hypothetical protein